MIVLNVLATLYQDVNQTDVQDEKIPNFRRKVLRPAIKDNVDKVWALLDSSLVVSLLLQCCIVVKPYCITVIFFSISIGCCHGDHVMLLAAHAIIINSSNWSPSHHYRSPSNRIITKYCHKGINSVG